MERNPPTQESKWYLLWNTLWEKTQKPFQHPELVLYLVFIVVIMGANGIFIAIGSEWNKYPFNHKNIILSICSYFVAILASSSVDLILSKPNKRASEANNSNVIRQHNQLRKMLTMVGISAIISGLCLTVLAMFFNNIYSYFFSFVGLSLALVIWLIANAENPTFTNDDEPSNTEGPVNQLGGLVSALSTPISAGVSQNDPNDLKDFKH